MELSVVRKVAQFIGEIRSVPRKNRGEAGAADRSRAHSADNVDISDKGSEASKLADYVKNLAPDAERAQSLARFKEAIEKGDYKMTEEMVENIAEKIAQSLV